MRLVPHYPAVPARASPADHASVEPDHPYHRAVDEDWSLLPHCRPLDHTMFDALDEYVAQKLPTAALYQALIDGVSIEVHGIYPPHLPALAPSLGLGEISPVPFAPQRGDKTLNFVRPSFFRERSASGERLLVAVTPGREYLRHYAGLIRHFLFLHTSQAQARIRIVRYPEAERSVASWTRLEHGFVSPGDIVIVGYVEEIGRALRTHGYEAGATRENAYYLSARYRTPSGQMLNLIGVKYSFWGGLAGRLTEAFCRAGASEILYCGKLGALSAPTDVYERIFCPSRFVHLEHQRLVEEIAPPPNRFLRRFPELDSGAHVSVPTVIEEDYLQRDAASAVAASSIDNEITHMAAAVASHNRGACGEISFSAIHFATDYVRRSEERHLSTPLNLSNNRTRVARARKQQMIERLCRDHLLPYFDA
jgi:hypothetical protein